MNLLLAGYALFYLKKKNQIYQQKTMSVIKAPYSEEKINLLKQLLQNSKQGGHAQDYEIKVDEMRVVPRTNDVEQFDNYEAFVGDTTRSVTIMIYDGTSRNNTKHIFSLQEEPRSKPAPSLSGVELEQKVQNGVEERVKEIKRQMKYERMEEENEELREENEWLHEVIDKWREKYRTLENKKGADSIHWGKLAGEMTDTLIKKNMHVIKSMPGLEGLAGILMRQGSTELDETESEQPETEASFKKKEANETLTEDLTEKQQEHLRIIESMEEKLGEKDLQEVMKLFYLLSIKPEAIKATQEFVIEYELEETNQPTEKIKTEAKPTVSPESKTNTIHTQEITDMLPEEINILPDGALPLN